MASEIRQKLTQQNLQGRYRVFIGLAIAAFLFLFALINPVSRDIDQFQMQDIYTIFTTAVIFFSIYLVLKLNQPRITELVLDTEANQFEAGVRILSGELLKVKTRRGLERLVGWEIASDFGLRSAELVSGQLPTAPYALQLPLHVSNAFLGTLFLGEKINGKPFTARELSIIEQMKKQVALILWSIELDEAITRTEELTELKSKFLANVTHELRTPLNGIINYIGFVLDDVQHGLNPEQKEYLAQALQSAEKLLQIINNILDMSKIEAKQMSLHLQTIDISEIIFDSSRYITHQIGDKPVSLVTDVAPNLPRLQGDRLRLRQVIVNILSNAVKFTQSGTIHLSACSENGNIVVNVIDTGSGINPDVLPTIFEQFISADLTDADQKFGPGLSMPITKSLVELHRGQINVDSTPGKGTTFTVTLPVAGLEKM